MVEQLNSFDTYFDMVYFINLPHRDDRYRNMMKLFSLLNITKYKRIIPIDKKELSTVGQLSKSSLSCKLAHMACLEDAKANNYERIMIFEDDACLNQFDKDIALNLDKHLEKCFKFMNENSWDVFFFDNIKLIVKRGDATTYWIEKRNEKSTDGSNIVRIGGKQFAHSYALSKAAISVLLQKHNSNEYRNDSNLASFFGVKYMYDKGIFDQLLNDKTDNEWGQNRK